MKSDVFVEESTERYRKDLKIDMEYNRIAFLRRQAKTPGWKGNYFELVGIVYVFMIAAFILGLMVGASG